MTTGVVALPAGVAAALLESIRADVRRVLGDELAATIAVDLVEADDGPRVRVRGEESLVDRIEAALYPPDGDAPGPDPTAAADPDRAPDGASAAER